MSKINASQFEITVNQNEVFLTSFTLETHRPFNFDDYKLIDSIIRNEYNIPEGDKLWISKNKLKRNKNRLVKIKL